MSELVQKGPDFSLKGHFQVVVPTEKFRESWPKTEDFQGFMRGTVLNLNQNNDQTTFTLSEITPHTAFDVLRMDGSIKPVI